MSDEWYDELKDCREAPRKTGADVNLMHQLTRPWESALSDHVNGGSSILMDLSPDEDVKVELRLYEWFQLDRIRGMESMEGLLLDLDKGEEVLAGNAYSVRGAKRFWLPMMCTNERHMMHVAEKFKRLLPKGSGSRILAVLVPEGLSEGPVGNVVAIGKRSD